jgi:hypothetical protein
MEECHGVIAMTINCQLESLMLDVGVVINPHLLERLCVRT